jgi:hypothetical protein
MVCTAVIGGCGGAASEAASAKLGIDIKIGRTGNHRAKATTLLLIARKSDWNAGLDGKE